MAAFRTLTLCLDRQGRECCTTGSERSILERVLRQYNKSSTVLSEILAARVFGGSKILENKKNLKNAGSCRKRSSASQYPLIVLSTHQMTRENGISVEANGNVVWNVSRDAYVVEVRHKAVNVGNHIRHFTMEYFEALECTQRRTCLSENE